MHVLVINRAMASGLILIFLESWATYMHWQVHAHPRDRSNVHAYVHVGRRLPRLAGKLMGSTTSSSNIIKCGPG